MLPPDLHGAGRRLRARSQELTFSNGVVVWPRRGRYRGLGALIALHIEWIAKGWHHNILAGHTYTCLHWAALKPSASRRFAFYGV
jgi:hypothetical protein